MSDFLEKVVIKPNGAKDNTLAEMRWLSNLIGNVYEEQLAQIKKLAALFFSPEVAIISISQESRFVNVVYSGPENKNTAKFPEVIEQILGDTWKTAIAYNVKTNDRPTKTRAKRNSPKSKRTSRTAATRNKRR